MKLITGTVVNGRVEVPANSLAEGARVAILATDPAEPVRLTPGQEEELTAALEAIGRGDYVDGHELLSELKSHESR